LKDGEITVIQGAVTTKQSILLSEVADIQIGQELQTIIEALANHHFVKVFCYSASELNNLWTVTIQMGACIEEHYKKHNKDYKVIRLMVNE
jgi:hypothetical protein